MRHSLALFVPQLTQPGFRFINAVRLLQNRKVGFMVVYCSQQTIPQLPRNLLTCKSFALVNVHDPVIIKAADDSVAAMGSGSYACTCSALAEFTKKTLLFGTADSLETLLLAEMQFYL